MGFIDSIKNEFRKENFSLNFEKNSQFRQKDPEEVLAYFHSSIWPFCNRFIYLIYRIGIAFYYTIWFIESIVRNAEFRAKNFYISNKKKTNSLLLHPWPFYMTSWSLTILFIHLWISAFITLYFYSINKKSCLASFFSYIFGPFSCSKATKNRTIETIESNRTIAAKSNQNNEKQSLNCCASNETSTPNQNEENVKFELETKSNLEIKEQTVVFVNNKVSNNLEENKISTSSDQTKINDLNNTYCDNKSNCYLHSSSVMSDAAAWKLWFDTHVPYFILVLIKISWLLYNIIAISAILVTVGYFTYVNLTELEVEPTWIAEIGNLHRHGVNSLVAIIDVFLLGYPVRLLHFFYTTIYGWTYALVSFVYWMQNPKENVVYEQIDYNKPLVILGYYLILTVSTFVMQSFHYFAYRFKLYLKDKYLQMNRKCFSSN